MNDDTEQWLGPMFTAQLADVDDGAAFLQFLGSAVSATAISARGVDWLHLGQLLRAELGWDHYPATPPRMSEFEC